VLLQGAVDGLGDGVEEVSSVRIARIAAAQVEEIQFAVVALEGVVEDVAGVLDGLAERLGVLFRNDQSD